jgi:methionyl-tRNA synthetase
MNRKTFYITTPIYYVNDVPHIGHAYTTIAADVLARFHRLRGEDVFFLTGTDEHGQKVQQAAAKRGVSPQQHCDELVNRFKSLWRKLQISNDDFIRTTEQRHKDAVRTVLQHLWAKDVIYEDLYQGWYCLPDERFWTEGELRESKCPECGRPVEQISEKNYFFKMSAYRDELHRHIKRETHFIQPESRRNEVLGFLEKPLGDLCISRPRARLAWGIPLPFDDKYVTYVWVDALVNYITAVGYDADTERFRKLWPADYHLVGKDILTTHAVYWSTLLLALELPLPKHLFAHGWWTVNREKMSKTRGNVVDPDIIAEEFSVDAFRYFVLREVPFGQDGDFSREALIKRFNSELANDLGNLVSRALTMIEQFSGNVIPQPHPDASHPEEGEVKEIALGLYVAVEDALNHLEFHRALSEIWKLVNRTNRYIEQMAPWELAKNRREQKTLDTVLYTTAESLRYIATYLKPFMPHISDSIVQQLGLDGIPEDAFEDRGNWSAWGGKVLSGRSIGKGKPLFPRVEGIATTSTRPSTQISQSAVPEELPNKQIGMDDFRRLDLRVGEIVQAERVPKSTKLLKLQVNLGNVRRQIVAGIGTKYSPEELIGKRFIIVSNLKATKIMGVESQGMILAAGQNEVEALPTFLEDIEPGTPIK